MPFLPLDLPAALDAPALDRLTRALAAPGPVLLRGSGEVFCRGMALDPQGDPPLRAFAALLDALAGRLCVAVVEGEALGGGLGLAAVARVVVAGPRARFGLPEALIGMIPAVVLPWIARRTGEVTAARLALTTAPVDAAEALRVGLADALTDRPDDALNALDRRFSCADPRALDALVSLTAGSPLDPAWPGRARSVGEALARSEETRRRVARLAAGDPPWEVE